MTRASIIFLNFPDTEEKLAIIAKFSLSLYPKFSYRARPKNSIEFSPVNYS